MCVKMLCSYGCAFCAATDVAPPPPPARLALPGNAVVRRVDCIAPAFAFAPVPIVATLCVFRWSSITSAHATWVHSTRMTPTWERVSSEPRPAVTS